MSTDTLEATPANMRRVLGRGVFAYDVATGERFSAAPGDYFWQPDSEPLRNEDGEPLILATERVTIIPAVAGGGLGGRH